MVTNPVPALLCGGEEPIDIRLTKVISAADMGVCRTVVGTLNVSPLGQWSVTFRKSLRRLPQRNATLYTMHIL